MDTSTLLQTAQDLLAPWTDKVASPEADRIDVYLPAEKIVEAVQAMIDAGGWYLSAITGLDVPQSATEDGAVELLYHFCQRAAVLTLRVSVPYGMPELPTICGVIPSANLYERELVEMLGVLIIDTPMHTKLLLPDEWPDYVYPLRKSFNGLDQL